MSKITRKLYNRKELVDKLTKLNIMYLYEFMCPLDYDEWTGDRRNAGFKMYHSDAMFNARVRGIVTHTMKIIDEHMDRLM